MWMLWRIYVFVNKDDEKIRMPLPTRICVRIAITINQITSTCVGRIRDVGDCYCTNVLVFHLRNCPSSSQSTIPSSDHRNTLPLRSHFFERTTCESCDGETWEIAKGARQIATACLHGDRWVRKGERTSFFFFLFSQQYTLWQINLFQ